MDFRQYSLYYGCYSESRTLRAGGDAVIDAARHFNIIDAATIRTFKNRKLVNAI